MQDQETNQTVTEEKKTERIDELDVIGGGILKILMNGFIKIKEMVFKSKN